ncbi:hypothetical protein J1N35_025823 [Gossypium stocksii]|uniref:Uncharacterized protein n=1 Tax=Gossypium stocksii TaxID=47602 RepID=A0A9D3V7L6_9ROSI|nr:hypothetical protein J1N35_025823 [Gossypium stocksii]
MQQHYLGTNLGDAEKNWLRLKRTELHRPEGTPLLKRPEIVRDLPSLKEFDELMKKKNGDRDFNLEGLNEPMKGLI